MASNGISHDVNNVHTTQTQDERTMLEKILSVSYGLYLTSYTRLCGYDDVNYHVTVHQDQHGNPCIKTPAVDGYVLRMFNAENSKQPQRMEATNAIMAHVKGKGIHTQSTVTTLQQRSISLWTFTDEDKEEQRVVCLRTFLPGQSLTEVKLTAAMTFKLGTFVANITTALGDFHHPFFNSFKFSWAVDNIDHLQTLLHYVEDNRKRNVIEKVLKQLSRDLFKSIDQLKIGQVHGDIRIANMVFQHPDDTHEDFSKWGLIDFHDTHVTFLLAELAVTACDLSQRVDNIELSSTLEAIAHLVTGYRVVVPLSVMECEFLVTAIKARLCMLVVHGYRHVYLKPDNMDYVSNILHPAWGLLEDIYEVPTQEIVQKFLSVNT